MACMSTAASPFFLPRFFTCPLSPPACSGWASREVGTSLCESGGRQRRDRERDGEEGMLMWRCTDFDLPKLFRQYYLKWAEFIYMNMNHPHQRWTRQLLRGSVLLSRPSTLKLVSLPLVSKASLRLALGPDNEVMLYGTRREGVIAGENVASRV